MAAPETEKTEKASKVDSPSAAAVKTPPPRPAGPPKKKAGGLLPKLLLSVAALALLAGAGGFAALKFRDADPRIGLAADYVEQGLAESQSALDKAEAVVADLTGSQKPASKAAAPHALLDKAPLPPAPEETPAAPPTAAKEAAAPATAPAPAETAKAPETSPAEKSTEEKSDAKSPEKSSAAETQEPKSGEIPEPPRKPVALAQDAAPADASAPALTAKVLSRPDGKAGEKSEEFSDRDLIAALEGRIDALSDEVQALRGRVDAPKSEARAAPETEVSKTEAEKQGAAPAAPDTTSAAVVLAFALQRDLESGRPFAEEIAALSRLEAEPAPAPVLVQLSEKGAATGAQLHDAFLPIAKKLKSHAEGAHDSGDIAGHLLEGASKLVKVRPVGQAHPESLDGKLNQIEAALAHNDFAAAERLFDSLPEEARSDAAEFGEALRQRTQAAKAADELLHGAIAALGKK